MTSAILITLSVVLISQSSFASCWDAYHDKYNYPEGVPSLSHSSHLKNNPMTTTYTTTSATSTSEMMIDGDLASVQKLIRESGGVKGGIYATKMASEIDDELGQAPNTTTSAMVVARVRDLDDSDALCSDSHLLNWRELKVRLKVDLRP